MCTLQARTQWTQLPEIYAQLDALTAGPLQPTQAPASSTCHACTHCGSLHALNPPPHRCCHCGGPAFLTLPVDSPRPPVLLDALSTLPPAARDGLSRVWPVSTPLAALRTVRLWLGAVITVADRQRVVVTPPYRHADRLILFWDKATPAPAAPTPLPAAGAYVYSAPPHAGYHLSSQPPPTQLYHAEASLCGACGRPSLWTARLPIAPQCPCGRACSAPATCSRRRCSPMRWRLVSAQFVTGWSCETQSRRHVSRFRTYANPRRPRYTPPQDGSSRSVPQNPWPSQRPWHLSPP